MRNYVFDIRLFGGETLTETIAAPSRLSAEIILAEMYEETISINLLTNY